jgi:hypothetical protein
MVAADGNRDGRDELYLAAQDLVMAGQPGAFDEAPTACLVRSEDYGRSWAGSDEPMFVDHQFTTVMFLDFGQSNAHAQLAGEGGDPFVYAYGLDGNWRTSFTAAVPDPDCLYLARVPAEHLMNRDAWEFFSGVTATNAPRWSADMRRRVPVLTDQRRLYQELDGYGVGGQSVIAQGGITYNAPLDVYLYSSWSEFTSQFYAAQRPWGPWRLFFEQDYGPYPWTGPQAALPKHGGYGTSIPSKFISADGHRMWVQSNWFWTAAARYGHSYCYALRELRVTPGIAATQNNPPAPTNLATLERGAVVIATTCRSGNPEVLCDGTTEFSEDSWNGRVGQPTYWGYTWPTPHWIDTVVFTSGPRDYNSGWFAQPPAVEARVNDRWSPVEQLAVTPRYECGPSATGHRSFTFRLSPTRADGIRLVGTPGGIATQPRYPK